MSGAGKTAASQSQAQKATKEAEPTRKLSGWLSSTFWRGWNRVRSDYKRLYPRSSVYQLSLVCAVTVAAIALAFVALRVWEYTHRLP
jgi:hypothetical protein